MLIQLEKVRKDYSIGDITVSALKGVDLSIDKGEFVAVMGPSGSGKSTLMNILGCLDRPTAGTYSLGGVEVGALTDDELSSTRGQKLGFVFQAFNLLPRMNALENVMLPLIYAKIRDAEERAMEALDTVGLTDRAHHWPNQLSGGQQQRVAIARALVNQPELILADEPTGALDTATSEEVMELFTSLNSAGNTIILITHEPHIADRAARKVTIRDGMIVEDIAGGEST